MPIIDPILGGAAGGFAAAFAAESLEPVKRNMTDMHRYALLFGIVAAILIWYLLLPVNAKRRIERR